jgi:predicted aspartyl protease
VKLEIPVVENKILVTTHVFRSAAQGILGGPSMNTPAPQHQKVRLLLDTGATKTCLDLGVIARLGLLPMGIQQMQTASSGHNGVAVQNFLAQLHIPHATGSFEVPTILVSGLDLAPQGIDGLLGMDVLSKIRLEYNGHTGKAALHFPSPKAATQGPSTRKRKR